MRNRPAVGKRLRSSLARRASGSGAWMSDMLIQTATLK